MKKQFAKVVFFLVILSSCAKDEGNVLTKQLTLPSFDSIYLNDFFDVFLIEDSSFQIQISAHEDLINFVNYDVVNGELRIRNDKKLKWTNPRTNKITLTIHANGLKEVHANETCNIKTLNPITTREFGIILKSKANYADLEFDNEIVYYWNNHPCGGRLNLKGRTHELKLWNVALMAVDASNLICEKALVENNSKGSCTVNVSQQLKYNIEGEGDIIVYGNPSEIINEGESGSGRIYLN